MPYGAEAMPPEASPEEPPEDPTAAQQDSGSAIYAKAGRTIRHAITDGDDAALGEAICALMDAHSANAPETADMPPSKGEKPSLALILGKKGK